MKLTLNWTNKYNLYMRYKNGENINKLHLELIQNTNYNIATTETLETTLNYWGEYYIKNIKYRSQNWVEKHIQKEEERMNKFAIHYKHQTPLPFEYDFNSEMESYFKLMDKLLEYSDKFDFTKVINSIGKIEYEIESITNPLGLTGFE